MRVEAAHDLAVGLEEVEDVLLADLELRRLDEDLRVGASRTGAKRCGSAGVEWASFAKCLSNFWQRLARLRLQDVCFAPLQLRMFAKVDDILGKV